MKVYHKNLKNTRVIQFGVGFIIQHWFWLRRNFLFVECLIYCPCLTLTTIKSLKALFPFKCSFQNRYNLNPFDFLRYTEKLSLVVHRLFPWPHSLLSSLFVLIKRLCRSRHLNGVCLHILLYCLISTKPSVTPSLKSPFTYICLLECSSLSFFLLLQTFFESKKKS